MLASGIVRRHGLWAVVVLTVSALLSLHLKPFLPAVQIFGPGKTPIGVRHPVDSGSAQLNKIITSHFDSPTFPRNLSSSHASQKLSKRAFDFYYYVCKGEKHAAAIEAAFNGVALSGLEFSDEDLKDGWNEFSNNATYYVWYLPDFAAIIASNIISPKYEVEKKFAGQTLSAEDIAKRVPKLNRFSDAIWTVWEQQRPSDPENVRYLGHDFITNPTTVDIMSYIFGAEYRGVKAVPWPGMPFDLDSDEGKALLASPNGVGTHWFLADRVARLKKRNIK
ncbi:MAG: hypothetical protein Q9168_004822, partial [Polycauliona sp. 1 TL-2023]